MKKFLILLILILLFCTTLCVYASNTENDILYLKSEEGYDYSSYNTYVARDTATGKLIPLSLGPLDGYSYAYIPGGDDFEIVKLAYTPFSDSSEYPDMWITEMQVRNVMTGYPDGSFRPDEKLTRAQMAVIFARLFNIDPLDKAVPFTDVSGDSWYTKEVAALLDIGVLKADTLFNPNALVTNEQFTAMLHRMLTYMGYIENGNYDFSRYTDYGMVSDYAKGAYNDILAHNYYPYRELIEHDYMDSADDEFMLHPQESISRIQCAETLYQFIRSFFNNNAPAILRDSAPSVPIPILDGSTSTYAITQNIYTMYYQNSKNCPTMPKSHSKTTNSYKRLIDGEVDMIFVPDPGEKVKAYAEEKDVNLKYIPIAGEALVFFTGKNNPAESITTEQLQQIYIDNTVDNWNQLGASNAPLSAFCRNEDSGSHAQIDKFVLNGNSIHPDIQRERTSILMSSIFTDLMDFELANPGEYGIGYSLYFYYYHNAVVIPSDFKLLMVDGIKPSDRTIADESYPYTTRYYAVIRDEKNPEVEAFVKLMQGEFGQNVVALSGYGTLEYPAGYPTE